MMQLTIERDALLKELGRVVSVVESKNTIPILANIHLDAGATHLMIRGTDLDIEVAAPCPAQVNAQGVTTVAGKVFADIVKKCPEGSQISITLDASRCRLKIVNGRSRFELPVLDAEDFPTLDAKMGGDARTFIMGGSELKAMLAAVRFAVSTDETRYFLNGIYFHQEGERLAAVATNGHQLSLTRNGGLPAGASGMKGVILPRKLVAELMRSLPDEGEISVEVSPSRVVFTSGELRIVSKLIDGTFPEFHRVIPKQHPHSVTVDRARLIEGVARVSVVADEKGRPLNLEIGKDGLRLACKGAVRGMGFEEMDAVISGPEATIGVNSAYLLDVVGAIGGDQVEIRYSDPASPLLIRAASAGDDGHVMVLMPMRANEVKEDLAA